MAVVKVEDRVSVNHQDLHLHAVVLQVPLVLLALLPVVLLLVQRSPVVPQLE